MWVTVVLILAVVVAGIGAAAFVGGGSGTPDAGPTTSAPAPVEPGVFELRQVLFQEGGKVQRKPPLAPGPASGGEDATRDLQRIDCGRPARPMQADDSVILCDSFGFRYGLGPSELPPDAVESAVALQGGFDDWVVQVQLTDAAVPDFGALTERLAGFGPPLNQAAIVLNGAVVSAPAVQEPISGGTLQITGGFTQDEAEALAASLG